MLSPFAFPAFKDNYSILNNQRVTKKAKPRCRDTRCLFSFDFSFIESGVGKEYNYESMKLFLFEQFSVLWLLKFINSHWIENSVDVKFSIQSLQYSCMVKIIRFIRTGLLECDENLQLKSKFIIA